MWHWLHDRDDFVTLPNHCIGTCHEAAFHAVATLFDNQRPTALMTRRNLQGGVGLGTHTDKRIVARGNRLNRLQGRGGRVGLESGIGRAQSVYAFGERDLGVPRQRAIWSVASIVSQTPRRNLLRNFAIALRDVLDIIRKRHSPVICGPPIELRRKGRSRERQPETRNEDKARNSAAIEDPQHQLSSW